MTQQPEVTEKISNVTSVALKAMGDKHPPPQPASLSCRPTA